MRYTYDQCGNVVTDHGLGFNGGLGVSFPGTSLYSRFATDFGPDPRRRGCQNPRLFKGRCICGSGWECPGCCPGAVQRTDRFPGEDIGKAVECMRQCAIDCQNARDKVSCYGDCSRGCAQKQQSVALAPSSFTAF